MVFIAFRLQPRSALHHCGQSNDATFTSSLPFGFNHVPHTWCRWFRSGWKSCSLHCLSASTTFRTGIFAPILAMVAASSLPFGFNHVPHLKKSVNCLQVIVAVFIAFRLQPRSAPLSQVLPPHSFQRVFIAFRLQPRSAQSRPIPASQKLSSLHCLSASTTFRTQRCELALARWLPESSLPFGFNHVPHSRE